MNATLPPVTSAGASAAAVPLASCADHAAAKAVALAERLLRRALAEQRPEEAARARQVSGLIGDPAAKALSMAMTDRLIRSSDAARAAKSWRGLLPRFGLPRGFNWFDRAMLRVGATASRILPGVVMAAVRARLP